MSLLNYIKQIWDTTSYVNPTRMNHIEDGIYAVSDKVDNLSAEDITYGSGNVKDIMDTEALTITYTQNSYVSSTSACSAYKKNNTYYFNLNIGVTGNPTPDFVEIGRISGWTAPKQLQMQVVGQSSSFTMVTVNITTSGVIQIYFPMTIASTTNFRLNSSQVMI